MPLSPSFDAIVNSDMNSLLSKSAATTDISKISIGSSASSDKMFKSVSESKTTSNVFGIFDTKQSVKELSGSTSSESSTEDISKVDPKKLANMKAKLGSGITSDAKYDSAVSGIMGKFGDIKQQSFSGMDGSFGGLTTILKTSSGGKFSLGNICLDAAVSSFIPRNLAVGDFKSLQGLFGGVGGLINFNTCDILKAALGFNVNLIDPKLLFKSLQGLFGILAKCDIGGILKCITSVQKSLTVKQRSSLSTPLIKSGSVKSISDLFGSGNNQGTILNKYSTARSIGTNRQVTYDPVTQRPNNTWVDPDTRASSDSLFTSMNVNKRDVFAEQNVTGNPSILRGTEDTVYNRAAIGAVPKENGFADYCFDGNGNDRLISNVPDSLFS